MFDIFYSGVKPNLFEHEREVENVQQAQALSRTRYFWWVTYLADLDNWDFLWEPVPWENQQRHAWSSQWQKDAGVYLIPKFWNGSDTHYHSTPVISRLESLEVARGIIEIDHLDGNAGKILGTTKRVRYFDNYKDTLVRIAKSLVGQQEFVWICSSICDYTDFDFSWHPDLWQASMLHVFASDEEKFGDTFFMHVPSFVDRAERVELLEWYDCNFVEGITVPRRPMPVVRHTYDNHPQAVQTLDWPGPLALFTNVDSVTTPRVAVPLWREKTKTIVPLSPGATSVIVPKPAVPYIKTQLYDYPYINKTMNRQTVDQPLDIVFISNGEPQAEEFYQRLEQVVAAANKTNRLHRIKNINGRAKAYHAAAEASGTDWFFAVFAKLKVESAFDWSWQPDRMQESKHYIFHAYNPVNELTYGHQAMIAYNRRLTLANPGVGLDFTLDQPHEVVPVLSGRAVYHTSDWMCWRTAFREAIKLRASLPDVENEYRLNRWLVKDNTDGRWSQKGAEDAVEYYESVNGDPTELKKSYEWAWLASYALIKRSLVAD